MFDEGDIARLIEAELLKVGNLSRRDDLRVVLVPPQRLYLNWDYGKPDDRFECWLVGLSLNDQWRLMYCESGFGLFGSLYQWGFVEIDEDTMGMDCQWHEGLEHAAIGAGILVAPRDYEVP